MDAGLVVAPFTAEGVLVLAQCITSFIPNCLGQQTATMSCFRHLFEGWNFSQVD